jgi:hypothetical protein
MVDGSEVAEAAGEAARRDDRLAIGDRARRYLQCFVTGSLRFGQQRNERFLDALRPSRRLELRR